MVNCLPNATVDLAVAYDPTAGFGWNAKFAVQHLPADSMTPLGSLQMTRTGWWKTQKAQWDVEKDIMWQSYGYDLVFQVDTKAADHIKVHNISQLMNETQHTQIEGVLLDSESNPLVVSSSGSVSLFGNLGGFGFHSLYYDPKKDHILFVNSSEALYQLTPNGPQAISPTLTFRGQYAHTCSVVRSGEGLVALVTVKTQDSPSIDTDEYWMGQIDLASGAITPQYLIMKNTSGCLESYMVEDSGVLFIAADVSPDRSHFSWKPQITLFGVDLATGSIISELPCNQQSNLCCMGCASHQVGQACQDGQVGQACQFIGQQDHSLS